LITISAFGFEGVGAYICPEELSSILGTVAHELQLKYSTK